jgi:hypothetical protein
MKEWFAALEQREQVFVATGAVAVLLALIYAFVWVPIDSGQKSLSASVSRWERSLAELKPLKGVQLTMTASRPATGGSSQQTPVVIVDQTLRARGGLPVHRGQLPRAGSHQLFGAGGALRTSGRAIPRRSRPRTSAPVMMRRSSGAHTRIRSPSMTSSPGRSGDTVSRPRTRRPSGWPGSRTSRGR